MHFHIGRFTAPLVNHLKHKLGSAKHEGGVGDELFCVESKVDSGGEGYGGRGMGGGGGDDGREGGEGGSGRV